MDDTLVVTAAAHTFEHRDCTQRNHPDNNEIPEISQRRMCIKNSKQAPAAAARVD